MFMLMACTNCAHWLIPASKGTRLLNLLRCQIYAYLSESKTFEDLRRLLKKSIKKEGRDKSNFKGVNYLRRATAGIHSADIPIKMPIKILAHQGHGILIVPPCSAIHAS